MGSSSIRTLLAVALLAVISAGTEVASSQCGPQPTVVYVQKGEKKRVSFWNTPAAADGSVVEEEMGSGDLSESAVEAFHVEDEASPAKPSESQQSAAEASGAAGGEEDLAPSGTPSPVIVLASPEEPPKRLYHQQPHIILPEAPPLQSVQPDTLADDQVHSAQVSASHSSADIKEVDAPSGIPVEGSGEALPANNGQDHNASGVDRPSTFTNNAEVQYDVEGSGNELNADVTGNYEGSGSFEILAQAAEEPVTSAPPPDDVTPPAEEATDSRVTVPAAEASDDAVTSVIQHVQTLVIGGHREADGLDEDELLPLVQHHESVQQLLSSLQDQEGDLGTGGSGFDETAADLDGSSSEHNQVIAVVTDERLRDSLSAPLKTGQIETGATEVLKTTSETSETRRNRVSGDVQNELTSDEAENGSGASEEEQAISRDTLLPPVQHDVEAVVADSDGGDGSGSSEHVHDSATAELETIKSRADPDTDNTASSEGHTSDIDTIYRSDILGTNFASTREENTSAEQKSQNTVVGDSSDRRPSTASDRTTPDRQTFLNNYYRLIQSDSDSNYPVAPVRPVWAGSAPSALPDSEASPLHYNHPPEQHQLSRVTPSPWRPYTAPRQQQPQTAPSTPAASYHPALSSARDDTISYEAGPFFRFQTRPRRPSGHVYFSRQEGRGVTRNTVPYTRRRDAVYRRPGGISFRSKGGATSNYRAPSQNRYRPADYVPVKKNPIQKVAHAVFDAKKSLRHLDNHFFRFLQSQPYPMQSAILYRRPQPRRMPDSWPADRFSWAPGSWGRAGRAAGINCEWKMETEPHLYLLVTLHNLSAPLSVDCMGAYIEVERENDGFEARWCGNRVRQEGSRPHLVFARGEVRIAVHSQNVAGDDSDQLPVGFDAEVEVIDLLDARQYATFRRSGLNFRRLIQEPVLPSS